jgi:sensor histidine kinase regulating citrate/malate metabolism
MNSHDELINYFLNGSIPHSEQIVYSANRGESAARLPVFLKFASESGLNSDNAALIVSSIGELTNNSFDHNLGFWKDHPGCCVSWSKENDTLTFGVADRGRGIVSSLQEVLGVEIDSQSILQKAFETIVTGRAPEKRGNGLKYVRKAILQSSQNSLKCFSNNCTYQINNTKLPVPTSLYSSFDNGTLIFFQWGLS